MAVCLIHRPRVSPAPRSCQTTRLHPLTTHRRASTLGFFLFTFYCTFKSTKFDDVISKALENPQQRIRKSGGNKALTGNSLQLSGSDRVQEKNYKNLSRELRESSNLKLSRGTDLKDIKWIRWWQPCLGPENISSLFHIHCVDLIH